jgi:Lar family restriction alleviation protein
MARRFRSTHRCPNPTVWTVEENSVSEELKPCPFCGGKAHIQRLADADGFGTFYYVVCTGCRAQSGSHYASKGNDCPQTYAEVRDEWNRRPPTIPADVGRRAMEALQEIVAGTERWNEAVTAIIGRQPDTGIGLEPARSAITELQQYLPAQEQGEKERI